MRARPPVSLSHPFFLLARPSPSSRSRSSALQRRRSVQVRAVSISISISRMRKEEMGRDARPRRAGTRAIFWRARARLSFFPFPCTVQTYMHAAVCDEEYAARRFSPLFAYCNPVTFPFDSTASELSAALCFPFFRPRRSPDVFTGGMKILEFSM